MTYKREGIIVLLDVLGVSNFSTEQCIELLKQKDKFVDFLKTTEAFQLVEQKSNTKINYYQFGDSIMITCNCGINSGYLTAFMQPLKQLMLLAIQEKILLRGAITLGEYVENVGENNVTVIGPAVVDAVSWYEAADWAGMIVTPKAANIIDWMAYSMRDSKEGNDALQKMLMKYPVPLKSGKEKMWAVNWPANMIMEGDNPSTEAVYEDFLRHIAQIECIPKGTENKYKNTLDFVRKCMPKR